ncbi:MAG: LamG-like jellyroll fold domain-containing protein [Planctomycetota bacterium]|jgi:hypothetical protein
MATANAVTFDGSNDYLNRNPDFTGNADTQQWTFSFWFKRNGTGSTQNIWHTTGNQVQIFFNSDDTIAIRAEASVDILVVDTSAITDTASWHNITASFDLSDSGKRHIYVDGSLDETYTTYTDDTIDCTRTDHGVAGNATTGSSKYDGDLAVFWLDFGQYIDLSVAANLDLFYVDGKVPVGLNDSADGATGSLSAPLVFLNNAVDSWHTNLGTGGGFTENGALTSATGPEIEGQAGNGALNSTVATISGSGWRDETGIVGTLNSTDSVVAGSGLMAWLGNGSLVSADSNIGGEPAVGFSGEKVLWDNVSNDEMDWDNTAETVLWGPIPGTIPGQGTSFSQGDGSLDSTSAVAGSGLLDADILAEGALNSTDSVIAGSGVSKSLATGTLNSTVATITGHGPPFIYLGNGALNSTIVTVAGSGTAADPGGRVLVSNVAGRRWAGGRSKRRPKARKERFWEDP